MGEFKSRRINMEFKRRVRKVFSQSNAKDNVVSATFARTFASFAVKSALAPLIILLIGAQMCLSQQITTIRVVVC